MEEGHMETGAEIQVKLPHAKERQGHLMLEEAGRIHPYMHGRDVTVPITP